MRSARVCSVPRGTDVDDVGFGQLFELVNVKLARLRAAGWVAASSSAAPMMTTSAVSVGSGQRRENAMSIPSRIRSTGQRASSDTMATGWIKP